MKRIVLAMCAAIVLCICVLAIPQVRDRFAQELTSDFSVLEERSFRYDTHFTGTSLRLRIWKFSAQLLHEHNAWFTGTGTGDAQSLLNEKYTSTGMYTGNPELHDTGYLGYGPHNQYVETALALGIPALLLFMCILFVLWKHALASRHLLLIQLLIIITCFMLTESVLSTAKGILFFMLFSTLLSREERSHTT